MRAASRDALAALRQHPALALGRTGANDVGLAEDLYEIADLLARNPQLRRTLGDPATAAEGRAGLAAQLLQGKIGQLAIEVTQTAVRQRWSSPWDLADALELTANDCLFAAAEAQQSLDEVEDQLFRFERILAAENALATLLDEPTAEAARRVSLLDSVLGQKVGPITTLLLQQAVANRRSRGITFAVRDLLNEASVLRERSVARVLSAVELSAHQQARLAAALGEIYGRAISVRAAVDPAVRGGLVVQVGDEVIDGSVAARLSTVRAALAS